MQTTPLTPGDYWDIVKRRQWGIILTGLLVFLLCTAVAVLLPSIYRSYATIMIEEQQIPSDFVMTTVNTYAEQRVENIRQRVLSFSQLWEIIERLDLYRELREKLTAEEVVEKMRAEVGVDLLNAEIYDRKLGRATAITTAFTVSYEGKSPQAVLKVTNTLTSLFLEQNLQVRQQRVSETSDFLADEAARVNKELKAADREVAEFKKKNINQLPELFQVNMQALNGIERNIQSLNIDMRSLKERRGYLDAQLSSMSPYLDEVRQSSRAIIQLKELQTQLAGLRQRYSEDYPDIGFIKAQMKELQAQVDEQRALSDKPLNIDSPDNPAYISLSSQMASIDVDIEGVKKQIEAYEKKAVMYRQRIESTPRVEEEYIALVNRRNALLEKYNDLNRKHQEAKVAQELEKNQKGERFTLIEPARFPEKPAKPNRLAIVLIGGVLAVGAGIGFGALRELSDQSVRSVDQLAALTSAPVFTGIPPIVTAEERARKQKRCILAWAALLLGIALAVVLFHYLIMDLDIFWAKLGRKIDRL
ncbi:MAG: chain-length determining protein [Deltaproteobacteria bacterium]|nr:MAG: chain-length determining protein [Deltaproteobacteria bacterium]